MIEAKKLTGLPIVVEITSEKYLDRYIKDVDIIQVGARNMQNFELLKALGKIDKPILLKRGLCATYKEYEGAINYILQGGNKKVILCERGIRTFETETRNTLDLQCIPIMKQKTNLPIIVDPSHAAGRKDIISTMSKGAFAVGANGIIVEVHNNPAIALSDKEQALDFTDFNNLLTDIKSYL
jgi:3-deoxy-7-phosphoheptulonate synthase